MNIFQALSRTPRLGSELSRAEGEVSSRKPTPYKAHLGVFGSGPLCGNGKTTIEGWQVVYGGLESVTCLKCLRKAKADVPAALSRRCRRCGCTWKTPCRVHNDTCHWVEPDLCSDCEMPKERRARESK